MILIGPFYTRQSYTKEAVNKYMAKINLNVKYYGHYKRKKFIPLCVYRYYEALPTSQKKLYPFYQLFFLTENRNLWNTFLAFYAYM